MLWIYSAIILTIAVFIILFSILTYNGLVYKRNMTQNALSTIETYLKKRYDLIPNLVSTVKAYMQHENALLTKIVELRAQAMQEQSPEKKAVYDDEISRVLRSIMVSVENYPTLKASETFSRLQDALNVTEDQIAAARRAYNAAVLDLNNAVQMFPSSIIARISNFTARKFIKIPEQERQNVSVENLFKE